MTVTIERIRLYPIKSLDGFDVSSSVVHSKGNLGHDRRFAIENDAGFVTGKRNAAVHRVAAEFARTLSAVGSDERLTVRLGRRGEPLGPAFDLDDDQGSVRVAQMLSQDLAQPVKLVEDRERGFPDDREASGPTVIGRATLETVAGWFDRDPEEIVRRFRPNIILAGLEPFGEERLVSLDSARGELFVLGPVPLLGMTICTRCVVVTRDPDSGEPTDHFARDFTRRREATWREFSPRARYDHAYRLAINTRPPTGREKFLREFVILESQSGTSGRLDRNPQGKNRHRIDPLAGAEQSNPPSIDFSHARTIAERPPVDENFLIADRIGTMDDRESAASVIRVGDRLEWLGTVSLG